MIADSLVYYVPRRQRPLEPRPSLDEGGGRLVVDGGEGGDVADELVQEGGLEEVGLLRDQGLLGEDDLCVEN